MDITKRATGKCTANTLVCQLCWISYFYLLFGQDRFKQSFYRAFNSLLSKIVCI